MFLKLATATLSYDMPHHTTPLTIHFWRENVFIQSMLTIFVSDRIWSNTLYSRLILVEKMCALNFHRPFFCLQTFSSGRGSLLPVLCLCPSSSQIYNIIQPPSNNVLMLRYNTPASVRGLGKADGMLCHMSIKCREEMGLGMVSGKVK